MGIRTRQTDDAGDKGSRLSANPELNLGGPRSSTLFAIFLLILLLALAVSACGGTDEVALVATPAPASEGVVQDTPLGESTDTTVSGAEAVVPKNEQALEGHAQSSETRERPQAYGVGDLVSIGDVAFAVLSWEEVAADGVHNPALGSRFITVELFILNRKVEPEFPEFYPWWPFTNVSLRKEGSLTQWSADRDFSSSLPDCSLLRVVEGRFGQRLVEIRPLAPGETIRSEIGFQVPEDSGSLQFAFRDPGGLGDAIVDLGPVPTTAGLPEELANGTEFELFRVGELISVYGGEGALFVLGWEERAGKDEMQPSEGYRFVAVELLLVNMGPRKHYISTFGHMVLRDSEARVYDVDYDARSVTKGGNIAGSLVVGERVRGEVVFQVPINSTGLTFAFDSFSGGSVHVSLGEVPGTVAPPAEIAGAPPLWTHEAGEPVTLGEIVVTVHEARTSSADDYDSLDTGNVFLMVDLTIENQRGEAVTISPLTQMSLKDSTGQLYDIDALAPAETMQEGQLAPGETVRGQVGFQVPAGTEGLRFVFALDELGQRKLFVELP